MGKKSSKRNRRPLTAVPGIDRSGERFFASAILLVVLCLVAYFPAVSRGGFVWDDDVYVTDNPRLRDWTGLRQIWLPPKVEPGQKCGGPCGQYYPMVHTVFWIEHRLWGLDPRGYHFVNVLLHSLSALLLWRILRRLDVGWPWMIAAVFALHPVHVESVAWVTELKNVLSGLFYFLAAREYFHLSPPASPAGHEPPPGWKRRYLGSLLFFICALASKTTAATFPAAVLLLLWWKRGTVERREVLRLSPFFGFGIGAGYLTAMMERGIVGAAGAEWSQTFLERCLIAGRVICFYASKLLVPRQLTFSYPRWRIDASAPLQYLYPAAVLLALALLWGYRTRIGRGPLTAALFFIGTLVPALGFINVYPMRFSFVADHFQYLASIGVLTLIVTAAASLLTRLNSSSILPATGAAACVILLVLTWRQCRIYEGWDSLWRDTLQKNPTSWLAHNNLAVWLAAANNMDEAIPHYDAAIELNPGYADAYFNRGNARLEQKEYARAISDYSRAVSLRTDYATAYLNRGIAYMKSGNAASAVGDFDRAAAIQPNDADAYQNKAAALEKLGRRDLALQHFSKAIALDPNRPELYLAKGNAQTLSGHPEKAIATYSRGIELIPLNHDLFMSRANAYMGLRRYDEAIADYSVAISLDGRDARAYGNRAFAYKEKGMMPQALQDQRTAMALRGSS